MKLVRRVEYIFEEHGRKYYEGHGKIYCRDEQTEEWFVCNDNGEIDHNVDYNFIILEPYEE